MITKICIDCNKAFEAQRKDTLRCPTCKTKHRSLQVMLSRKKSHPEIEIGVGSGKGKTNRPGPENHSWKTGIQGYRKLATSNKCCWCGATENLLVHHLDENRYNNTVENLVVVCKRCHQKHHIKRDPITGRYLAK